MPNIDPNAFRPSPSIRPIATATPAAPGEIRFVGAADFNGTRILHPGKVVVEFMTYACGHCRNMEPVVHQAAREMANEVTFFQVNVPLEQDVTARFGISGTPTFILFEEGQMVGRTHAPPDVGGLKTMVRNGFVA